MSRPEPQPTRKCRYAICQEAVGLCSVKNEFSGSVASEHCRQELLALGVCPASSGFRRVEFIQLPLDTVNRDLKHILHKASDIHHVAVYDVPYEIHQEQLNHSEREDVEPIKADVLHTHAGGRPKDRVSVSC